MNEEEEFRLWLFWTTPRELTMKKGYVYCPYIPEVFKNWTQEQFEKELERLKNLKCSGSFYGKIIKTQ